MLYCVLVMLYWLLLQLEEIRDGDIICFQRFVTIINLSCSITTSAIRLAYICV